MKSLTKSPQIAYSALGQRAEPPIIADLMHRALAQPHLLSLAAGFTDNATLPAEVVTRIVNGLQVQDPGKSYLQYGSNRGRVKLLEASAQRLNELEQTAAPAGAGDSLHAFSPDELFFSNGSQQALYLAMQCLCEPGDIVLVERPTYFVFLELLKGLGVEPVALPLACGELDLAECRKVLAGLRDSGRANRVRAVYIQSFFANPSASSLSETVKNQLAAALGEAGLIIPVIEDAAYREIHFAEPYAARSIFSLSAFEAFPKLYLGTYTKPFATGLKIGFAVCSHPDWQERMLALKGHQDFGSAHFNQAIIEAALISGEYQLHLEKIRGHYAQKANVMGQALEDSCLRAKGWSWQTPAGGLYYWLQGPHGLDCSMQSAFCEACVEAGVLYVPGDLCMAASVDHACIRLSFGAIPLDQLDQATRRFTGVAERF